MRRAFIAACLAGIVSATTSGQIGQWHLDGDAQDSSGNGYHGTVVGASPAVDRFGLPAGALSFDGTDDYIDLGNSAGLEIPIPATIAGWVLIEEYGGPILTNDFLNNTYSGIWLYVWGGGQLVIAYGDGGGTNPSSRRNKTGTTHLELGQWYHVAGVIRVPQDMDLYLDGCDDGGVYEGSGGPLTYTQGPAAMAIKDFSGFQPPNYLRGSLDEVLFFDRALSATEVLALASNGPNSVGHSYCSSTPNSTGQSALISATGSPSISKANLTLIAAPVPNKPGLFFFGPIRDDQSFGNGRRCVGGALSRLPVGVASGNALVHQVDFATPPGTGLIAGSTWHFQAWFRDPAAGGAFFNLSDGLTIRFCP